LFGGARPGSLQVHLRHQARDAVVLRRLSEQAATKNRPDADERQPMIFAH